MTENTPFLIDFSKPSNLPELAKFLGAPLKTLENLCSVKEKYSYFERHEIPKRNARHPQEYRIVWEPDASIADIYKAFFRRFDIYTRFANPNYPHPAAYGYTRGRSTVQNAQVHCGSPKILHADIENFFNSISQEKVEQIFISLNLQKTTASLLAEMLTIEGALPLGLHSSPLIADISCLEMDTEMSQLAKTYQCKYTRYADDISISGYSTLPSKTEVRDILSRSGFYLSERKFRITKSGQAHYVTGLSISGARPRIPRKIKKRLRQELYYCTKFGVEDHLETIDGTNRFIQSGINRIDGMVRYVSHVEAESWPNLRQYWTSLLDDEGLTINYPTFTEPKTKDFVFYVDESQMSFQGKEYLALSLARTEDHLEIEASTQSVLNDFLIDPFTGGHKRKLEKMKLHYTDANLDLRTAYIDKLAFFPFKGYLTFKTLSDRESYEQTYLYLLEEFLPHRLMTCDQSVVHMFFEENPQVLGRKIRDVVEKVFNRLEETRNRRPYKVHVHIGKKSEHACFSVPDFLLGVFAKYACSTGGEKDVLFFEKLRDCYRIIFDADKKLIFSRKRPFLPW